MRPRMVVIASLVLATAPAWAQKEIHETHPLSSRGRVEIENIVGSVQVTGWDRDEAQIDGTVGRGTEEVAIHSDADRLSIEVVLRSGRNVDAQGTDLQIRLPRGVELKIETVSAPIDVDGISGSLELESVSADITVGGTPREIKAESVSGAVKVDVQGTLDEASLESVSGRLFLSADYSESGEYELESMSGSVEVRVPSSLCAEFDVETFSGRISNDLGPSSRRSGDYGPGEELSFSTCRDRSGASFSVSSFSGRVQLHSR